MQSDHQDNQPDEPVVVDINDYEDYGPPIPGPAPSKEDAYMMAWRSRRQEAWEWAEHKRQQRRHFFNAMKPPTAEQMAAMTEEERLKLHDAMRTALDASRVGKN
jgi:hypothetical protein